ncbi:fumarylacetoacetate hydrolase family protein [Saccharopolyspora pogona]|uniref:fumarylacetoacetate hydrolase family protein n=1 Tax=Saccharopolyspora pogona TaxID=333966 RepID=UPI0021E004AA|nr:fumarylacetoacetate hydrolase family protein [Saccharopolyspora pogona]
MIAGANYRDHVEEAGMPMPTAAVFIAVSGEMVVGPNSPILLPAEAPGQVDYEGELAVVINAGWEEHSGGTGVELRRWVDHRQ